MDADRRSSSLVRDAGAADLHPCHVGIGIGAGAMRLTLSTDKRIALRRYANEAGVGLEIAAQAALRDWLIGQGYLEPLHELDEDTETVGEA